MPKLDQCHNQIVRALEKDGWRVDAKPRRLVHQERLVFIDIRARRQINASGQQILLAEIKCFPDRDRTTLEVYIAFGQYIIYRALLAQEEIRWPL
jgi:XisH protein